MKKYLFFLAAAATMFAACSKSPSGTNDALDNGTPVAVQFKSNVTASIGKAAIDEWSSQNLYIYGFERTDPKTIGVADLNAPFIDNVLAIAPGSGVEGSIDVYDPSYTEGDEDFYYKEGVTYDFYGYYVADAVEGDPAPAVSGDNISIPVEINGTQDILLAMANPNADRVTPQGVIATNRVYSSYSARRGVVPTLLFEHQLSRFEFVVVPGDETAKKMTVDSLCFKALTLGNLTIVSNSGKRGLVPADGAVQSLFLMEADGATRASLAIGSEGGKMGESVMVMPQDSYHIALSLSQEGTSHKDVWETDLNPAELKLADDSGFVGSFEAGKKYIITIKVYGFLSIEINVKLAEWDEVEVKELDPDDDPEGIDKTIAVVSAAGVLYMIDNNGVDFTDQPLVEWAGKTITDVDGNAIAAGEYSVTFHNLTSKADENYKITVAVDEEGVSTVATVEAL